MWNFLYITADNLFLVAGELIKVFNNPIHHYYSNIDICIM